VVGSNKHASSPPGRARARISGFLVRRANIRRSLDPGRRVVALTFDDGPDPVHTVRILDELGRLGTAATFFVVGESAREHPELVRRMLAEGHAVGSHSASHPEPWRLRPRELALEYRRGRALVEEAAGRRLRLFRPPKGHVDGRGAAAMLSARLRPWLWTIDPGDWEPGASAAEIVSASSGLSAGDVVLLHDAIKGPLAPSALDRSATCAALPALVQMARERGLSFATLD